MQTTLKDFVAFIQTIWGILAGITTFFPLFGSLIPLMPVPEGTRLRTSVWALIASSFSLLLVFLTVRTKDLLPCMILALILFCCALFFFIASRRAEKDYWDEQEDIQAEMTSISAQFVQPFGGYRRPRETGKGELTKLLHGERMMLFYILTFMCLTGAFSILAALDFWRSR